MGVPEYRLFCVDEGGQVASSFWIEARSDEEALLDARTLRPKRLEGELWHRTSRLVARLNRDGELETA